MPSQRKPKAAKKRSAPAKPFEKGNTLGNRFKAGQSGNPGGAPKGFKKAIYELTDNGRELVEIALGIAKGETVAEIEGVAVAPDFEVRMEAIQFLADHGWGKPKQAVELDASLTQIVTHEDALKELE